MSAYKVISVQKAQAPQGDASGSWHSYVIANGNNTIVGYRNGSLHEVKLVADDCVKHLNEKYRPERSGNKRRGSYPMGTVEAGPSISYT